VLLRSHGRCARVRTPPVSMPLVNTRRSVKEWPLVAVVSEPLMTLSEKAQSGLYLRLVCLHACLHACKQATMFVCVCVCVCVWVCGCVGVCGCVWGGGREDEMRMTSHS
jgi:hypothetical protein